MSMVSAAAAVAALIGAGADGYLDTKYAFNKDGTQRAILGMPVGMFVGVVAAGLGLFGVGGSYSGILTAAGLGVLCGEGMRYAANRTASAMQGTQGVRGLPAGQWHAPPMLESANGNGYGYARGPVTSAEFSDTLDRLAGLRAQVAHAA